MTIEIVNFPIKNGDFPVRYVNLPEGILYSQSMVDTAADLKIPPEHSPILKHQMMS